MQVNIFKKAHKYLDKWRLEYKIIPTACNIEAETYEFKESEDAIQALAELNQMIYECGLVEYVRLSMELTPHHYYVTIEEGDEEWDYNDEEE